MERELQEASVRVDVELIQRLFHDGPYKNRALWVPALDRVKLSCPDGGSVTYRYNCNIDKMVLVKGE